MPYAARGYYAGRYSGGRFINKFKNAAKKLNSFAMNAAVQTVLQEKPAMKM